MAAESYWNYAVDPSQQAAAGGMALPAPVPVPAPMWQQAVYQPAVGPVAPPMATPPLPPGPPPSLKRQRPDYFDMPSGQNRGSFHEAMGVPYGHHLNNEMSYVGASQTARPLGGMGGYPVDNNHMMHTIGARSDSALPPDASNTLYVEGLPSNCTRREVSHIFRPFPGFHEVRLVNKESRHPGRYHVLCFVDFATPTEALAALETLQGYKFDEHDHHSSNLRIQFSLSPGLKSRGSPRGRN